MLFTVQYEAVKLYSIFLNVFPLVPHTGHAAEITNSPFVIKKINDKNNTGL